MIPLPIALVIGSIAALIITFRLGSRSLRMPLGIYCGSYLLTTAIGATIIALPGGRELWTQYNGGADPTVLQSFSGARYWLLLYLPFIVPPLVAMAAERVQLLPGKRVLFSRPSEVIFTAFAIIFGLLVGYCFGVLAFNGYLSQAAGLLRLQGDYVSVIQLRAEIFSRLGRTFFGLAYIGLPVLSHIALYQALRLRKAAWRLALLLSVVTICVLVLLTAQKGPLLLYFLTLAIGYAAIRRARLWVILAAGLACLAALDAFQIFVLGDWTAVRGLFLVIFRMANSFPYYSSLYPDVLPFTGADVGLDLFGLAPKPNENEVVFNYMYPGINWVQGAAPAPAHLAAYAQGGWPLVLLTLAIIGIAIVAVARIGRRLDSALRYGAYIGGLLFLYYLTQITLRGALITNYGMAWTCVVLVAVSACSSLLRNAAARVRRVPDVAGLLESQQ